MSLRVIRAVAILAAVTLMPVSGHAQQMKSDHMGHGGKLRMGHQHATHTIEATNAWSRATAPSAKAGAVFLELTNTGETPDLLVAATSDVSDRVELHTHLMENGVMKMRKVEGFEVAPGAPTVLAPGGNHIMLLGLRQQLKPGETVPVTLTFRDAGEIKIEAKVGPAGARSHGSHGAHGGHGGS